MIVVGMPTEQDERANTAFISKVWHSLLVELKKYDLDLTAEWVYAQPCRAMERTAGEEKKCQKELIHYLHACECNYALLIGDKALRIFTYGEVKALKKNRGTVVRVAGIAGVPVYDYMDVLRDRELEPTFHADLRFFKRLVEDDFVKPKYTSLGTRPKGDTAIHSIVKKVECVAYDIETTGLDHRKGKVKMIGMAWREGGVYGTCIIYPEETPFTTISPAHLWSWKQINELFQAMPKTVAHNGKFDDGWLLSRGVQVHMNFDTLGASYLEKPLMPHTLKFLACNELSSEWYAEGIDHDDLSEDMRKKLEHYCQLDCYFTLRLRELYMERELKYPLIKADYRKPFAKIIMPGIRVLERVEQRGVHVSKERLESVHDYYVRAADDAKNELEKLLPKDVTGVNYDSPAQLRKLLYGAKSEGGFGYKKIYIEKSANPDEDDPTTGKAALKKLARQGSTFASKLLEYRGYAKALNAFVNPWLEKLDANERLYPTYNITRTSTGRLSCQDPNLQQVTRDKLIRNLVAATPGYKFIEADYSQIELRVAAWIGRIESMKRIYREGGDIHLNTGASIARLGGIDLSVAVKDLIKLYRQQAKAVNFGFVYGMGAEGFMDYADASYDVVLTKREAEEYRRLYFTLYPELVDWHDRIRAQVKRDGYIVTPTGRVRPLPNIHSIDNYLVGKALRCGINTPVQSFASDLTLLSMIDMEAVFESESVPARLVGQCHDAVFVEAREDVADAVCEIIHYIMTHPRLSEFGVEMDVPIEVEIKIGSCWGDPEAKIYVPRV